MTKANHVTVVGEGQNYWPRTANVVTVRDTIAYTDTFTRGNVHCTWDSDESKDGRKPGQSTTNRNLATCSQHRCE